MAQRNACAATATAAKTISSAFILKCAEREPCTERSPRGEQGETVAWAPISISNGSAAARAASKWLPIDEIENGSPFSGASRHSTGSEFAMQGTALSSAIGARDCGLECAAARYVGPTVAGGAERSHNEINGYKQLSESAAHTDSRRSPRPTHKETFVAIPSLALSRRPPLPISSFLAFATLLLCSRSHRFIAVYTLRQISGKKIRAHRQHEKICLFLCLYTFAWRAATEKWRRTREEGTERKTKFWSSSPPHEVAALQNLQMTLRLSSVRREAKMHFCAILSLSLPLARSSASN